MNFWTMILFAQAAFLAGQIAVSIVASIREHGEDSKFMGDKIAFRS